MGKPPRRALAPPSPSPTGAIVSQQFMQASQRTGPLPAPEELERYERILPGVGKTLLDDFQKRSEHTRTMDLKVLESYVAADKRNDGLRLVGLLGGGGLALLGMGGAVYLKSGMALGSITIAVAVAAITGKVVSALAERKSPKNEDEGT